MLYSSGTTGRPKGVQVPLPDAPLGTKPAPEHGGRGPVLLQRGHAVPEPGAAVPRRPAALHHGRAPGGRHRLRDGALRPGRGAAADPGAPHHPQPVGPHHVHPHAQAARRGASGLRRVLHGGHVPRRRPVPGRGEAEDDRLVRAGGARVLRRHRGQRLRLLQQRGLAGPPRHRRPEPPRRPAHHRRRRQGAPGGRARHHLVRERLDLRVPQRPGEDGRLPPPGGLEHPGRRGPPRRGRVPLPHRPQGVHDHHRRGERVPPGGRERPRPAPQGGRRGRLRRAQRRLRRGGQGRGPAGRHGRRRRRPGQGAHRLLPGAPGRREVPPHASTSAPSCPATPPASSTSACSRTSTGRPPAARSEAPSPQEQTGKRGRV